MQLTQEIDVEPWRPQDFKVVRTLQDAPRNFGRVDLMKSIHRGGTFVAVKRMPNVWMTSGHREFTRTHPDESEHPWIDISVLKYLNSVEFPYVCALQGVFCGDTETFVVSTFATEGDLYSWTQDAPCPGATRESLMQPIAKQISSAMQWLHELEITHGDLSLENILLTCADEECPQVKLVDFGMATVSQKTCWEPRGKPLYQAPEMHQCFEYDPMPADAFAFGVLLFVLAWNEFPWNSTMSGRCPSFDFVQEHGLRQYLANQHVDSGASFTDVVSEPLIELMEGLLAGQPEERLSFGATCWQDELMCPVVWDLAWLRGSSA